MKRELLKRRLIQTKETHGHQYLTIHRELQRNVREELALDRHRENVVFNQALHLVHKQYPEPSPIQVPEPDKWPEYKRLLPHVFSLRQAYIAAKGRIRPSQIFGKLLSDVGINQWEQGVTKEGIQMLYTAEEIFEGLFDDTSATRANIHTAIAMMTENTGIYRRKEGLERREKVLAIRERIASEKKTLNRQEEMLLYNAYMDLVLSLLQYNDYKQAEPIVYRCLEKYKEWGTEDEVPYEYAKYYHNLSIVQMFHQDFENAIDSAKLGVYWMGKSGKIALSYRFKFDLACILTQSGKLREALEMHKGILKARSFIYGKNNELTLHSCYAVAVLHEALEEFDDAE